MRLCITGERQLTGTVKVSGAKNSVLVLMAAALLGSEPSAIQNVPDITDVETMTRVITGLGARVRQADGTITIDPRGADCFEAPHEFAREMRASIQIMGPVLARLGRVRIPQPGGCEIGPRPIDFHLRAFELMGATIKEEYGFVEARAKRLNGAEIHLDFPSVGATENIIAAACLAQGETVIRNAAKEPEVVEQQNFLNRLGADIRGAGTDTVRIRGVRSLGGTTYQVIPDRVEAGTFMAMIAATMGDATVENVICEHVGPITAKMREAGVEVEEGDSWVRVRATSPARAVVVRSLPYPGFPTDMQPQMTALLTRARGTSIISDNVFPNRFKYVDELRRMGANIRVEGRAAVVEGTPRLWGTTVDAPDLRGGAALVIAALAATGETLISNVHHINRGYESMVSKLRDLGARVETVEEPPVRERDVRLA